MGRAVLRRQLPVVRSRLLKVAITELVKQNFRAGLTERCYNSEERSPVAGLTERCYNSDDRSPVAGFFESYLRFHVVPILALD